MSIILASVMLITMPSCVLQREVVIVQDEGGRPLANAVVSPQPITLFSSGNQSSPIGRLVVVELKGRDTPYTISKHGYLEKEIAWDEIKNTDIITLRKE